MSSTLTFSLNSKRRITYIHHGAALNDVVTYAGNLQPYTRAEISRATVTLQAPLTPTPSTGEYDSTDLFAKIFVRENSTGDRYFIILPAPISTMFEFVSGKGWRVTETSGNTLAGFYSAFSGLTLDFVEGWLCGVR